MQYYDLARRARPAERALAQREVLRREHGHGVLDWGPASRPGCRYEAYWRGLSLGFFDSARAAWAYLWTFPDVPRDDAP
jgi:hypothetical protein